MRIGVPKEIKNNEFRVGMVPAGVRELTGAGHEVMVETGAGNGIGVDDAQYKAAVEALRTRPTEGFRQLEAMGAIREVEWRLRPQEASRSNINIVCIRFILQCA